MSFRNKSKGLVVKKLGYPEAQPRKGVNTLIWWRKGNAIDGYWFKGDLFGTDAKLLDSGFIDESLEALTQYVEETYGIKR
ncbi:hypothetical protein VPHD390_0145 [Vibrio phage D390]